MIFFLDENFPKLAGVYLESIGHKIIDIRSTKNEGLDDLEIFEMAQHHRAIFLTTDRDFFHTIPYLFDKHYGVIVIALSKPNRQTIINKLKWAIEKFDLLNFSNKIVLMRNKNYSISVN
ncbi:MAG: DUF5615 family PIN-like protein [Candidatus Marinimicrobia bacterium]|nr:DUF5615 family PIN-like protein [Candidatus Neomarinimicrobiota bacterium]